MIIQNTSMASNIKIIKGNIFNTTAQTIVNTVNCVGVMGKGIALVYKLRYPNLFGKYQELCKQHLLDVGKLWLYKEDSEQQWVLNFPTKKHWKYPSQYSYIEAGLQKFVDTYQDRGITSIAFPLLGTNNGGLDESRVMNIMTTYLSQCTIPVEIYQYDPLCKDDLLDKFREQWDLIPVSERKAVTGIRMQKQIDIIDEALHSDNIQSMIALIEYPGIGLTTMQKCFKLVMECKTNVQLNLFTMDDIGISGNDISLSDSVAHVEIQSSSEDRLPAVKVVGKIDLSQFERPKKELSKTKRNYYIIDTNVFVNCPEILSKIDMKYPIILSAKVVDELDKMKIKLSEQEKRNAEKALRLLNQDTKHQIIYQSADVSLLPPDFDKRSPDNMILSVALKFKDENPIVLTSDNGLQLKCKTQGITTITLKDFLKR